MKTKRDNFLTWVSAGLASVILIAVSGTLGWAHSTDESYIWLDAQSDRLNGRVEFRLDDLRKYFDLDVPQDVAAAREFVNANRKKIEAYIQEKFQLHSIDGSVIPYHFVNADVLENDVFGHFAQFFYSTDPMDSVPTRVGCQESVVVRTRQVLSLSDMHGLQPFHRERVSGKFFPCDFQPMER